MEATQEFLGLGTLSVKAPVDRVTEEGDREISAVETESRLKDEFVVREEPKALRWRMTEHRKVDPKCLIPRTSENGPRR